MTIMNLQINDALHKRFKILCVKNDISQRAMIVKLIKEYVEKEEKKEK